jgi:hypothetical protein
MLTASDWKVMRELDEALIVVSTRAGQKTIRGIVRPPHPHLDRKFEAPTQQNPVARNFALTCSCTPLNNAVQKSSGRYSALTTVYHDGISRAFDPARER